MTISTGVKGNKLRATALPVCIAPIAGRRRTHDPIRPGWRRRSRALDFSKPLRRKISSQQRTPMTVTEMEFQGACIGLTIPRPARRALGASAGKRPCRPSSRSWPMRFPTIWACPPALFLAPPGDCTRRQVWCVASASGGEDASGHEVSDGLLYVLADYVAALDVPPAPNARQGRWWSKIVSNASSVPDVTRPITRSRVRDGSPVKIAPYTDLLLHDMGAGSCRRPQPTVRPTAANGAPHRSGASARFCASTPAPVSCMTAEHGPLMRPFSGMAARLKNHVRPTSRLPNLIAKDFWTL